MKKELHAIRGIDEEVLRKFKVKTIEERMRMGEALTQAMQKWIREKERKQNEKPIILLKAKPFDWGEGTEKTSKEVDEILYGRNK